ncbi:MAG: cytochrome c-type biogenesis CcmF C-terminal domain-containing protein, partial [Acidimicrobiia bacterium]
VLDSVHSFTESPIGVWLLSAFAVVVAVSLGLVAWRGDRLRSPGRIDSPLSREGAFLTNNVLFAAFAFVVLLGTVFPLLTEALRDERITVGRPYFDRMTTPIGLALLLTMAVAPVLPWRKASSGVLRERLLWPAWAGVAALFLALAVGARGLAPLLAFGLGGVGAGSAVRQVVLAARAARRSGTSIANAVVGRTNGGMVVHLGVIVVAMAFTAAQGFTTSAEFRLAEGETARLAGHTITYLGAETVDTPRRTAVRALVRVDGDRVHAPALSRFKPSASSTIGTPSVAWGLRTDVYLTLVAAPEETGGEAVIGMAVEPLASWLWIGGGIMALGTVLALVPGRRRRPTAPVSAPPSAAPPADEPVLEPA